VQAGIYASRAADETRILRVAGGSYREETIHGNVHSVMSDDNGGFCAGDRTAAHGSVCEWRIGPNGHGQSLGSARADLGLAGRDQISSTVVSLSSAWPDVAALTRSTPLLPLRPALPALRSTPAVL
jgi:hypothetical protein